MKLRNRILSLVLALVLMCSILPVNTYAKGDIMYGVAWVNGNNLRLRSAASTGSTILDAAAKGEVVVVVGQQGDWYKVVYDLQVGYMHGDYLKVLTKENVELGYGKINGNSVNLRSGPSTSNASVAKGYKGDSAYIIGINEGWYKVIFGSKICYIRSDYLDLTEVPYENKGSSNSPKFFENGKSTGVAPSASALNGGTSDSGSSSGSTESGSTSDSGNTSGSTGSTESTETTTVTGALIVETAKKYLGTPYLWGGEDPSGFDCSGFVYYVYNSLGIKISRTQATMYAKGTPVAKEDLQPGDIVFFQNTYKEGISHCGIYVGDGQFIHSPSSGEVVSYDSLSSTYYTEHWYGACRYN